MREISIIENVPAHYKYKKEISLWGYLKAPKKVPLKGTGKRGEPVVRYNNALYFKKEKKKLCNATFRPEINSV